jgi:hypothetical protein
MNAITRNKKQEKPRFHEPHQPTRHVGYKCLSLCRGEYAKVGADRTGTGGYRGKAFCAFSVASGPCAVPVARRF